MENNLIKQIQKAFSKEKEHGTYHGVRKFKHGQLLKNVWFVHSYKNNANIACESDIEKKLCLYTEFEPNVIAYRPQPLKMYVDDFAYTPDFVVKLKSGLYCIREAKRESEALSKHYKDRFKLISEYCKKFGVDFQVYTDVQLKQALTQSHELIYHFARGIKVSKQALDDCFQLLNQHSITKSTIGDLQEWVENTGFDKHILFPMILQGMLSLDYHSKIDTNSTLWVGA
jgi:hypothetical protein